MSRLPLLAALLAVAAPALAQSERVTIKLVPEANQTLRFRNTQDMDMSTDAGGQPDGAKALPPMALKMHTVMDATSAIGPTDSQGHYTSRVTIDHLSIESTMNGQPMPLPVTEAIEKQVVIFSYDDEGKVIDIAVDGAARPAIGDAIKQMMTRAFASMAPMTLSVGESVTVPLALNLPIPAAPGSSGFGINAETRFTLGSVTFDGADRIAHLTLHTSNTMAPGATPSTAPMTMTMTSTGEGKMDINVDRGIVLHAEQRSTIESTMQAPAKTAAAVSIRMHGTFSMVSDLVK